VRDADKVTINDVAAKAAISRGAVSQILNDKGSFPKTTIERVKKAAEDLGYRPSKAAASLRTGKTLTIGMVVSGSHDPLWSSQWVHVTARLLVDAAEELNRRGYSLLVLPSTGIESINRDDVDAVIISDSMDDDPALEAALGAQIPVMTNDRLDDDRITVHVDSGYAEMTQLSFDVFQQRGRLKPALLTEPSEFHTDAVPERLWRALCEASGVAPLIENVEYDRRNLETAVQSLLDDGADAIFSFAGEGIRVAQIIESAGMTLGQDIFLITCEMGPDLPTADRGISTLHYHAERGALVGVPILLETLNGSRPPPQTVSLGWQFIDKSSTSGTTD
jgi:DNA-binding LacI/PurR family transcriptional regulator